MGRDAGYYFSICCSQSAGTTSSASETVGNLNEGAWQHATYHAMYAQSSTEADFRWCCGCSVAIELHLSSVPVGMALYNCLKWCNFFDSVAIRSFPDRQYLFLRVITSWIWAACFAVLSHIGLLVQANWRHRLRVL